MIYPNMATTLGFVFTDATISSAILKNLLKKNITNTFNAITCDGDTSTNDMVTIFSTGVVRNSEIKSALDPKVQDFSVNLNRVLLNLAKRVAADGEGSSKFIEIQILNCKTENDAKKISFSIANSILVKTAIAGEDPNWGRIVMAIGKSNVKINPNKIFIKMGNNKIIDKGQLSNFYNEDELVQYMKNDKIEIIVDLNIGNKNFTAYTMDLTKKYIEINSDYRT
jgi:glutamate N-acetyltransferase/amino-acid N-acetyltransferase